MKKVGIIVGRFQTPYLTSGHCQIIDTALSRYDQVIILVGDRKDGKLTTHDPLTFEMRKEMIVRFYKERNKDVCLPLVYRIEDIGNWPAWTKELDDLIETFRSVGIISVDSEIIMVGSRDSFISGYKKNNGIYETVEITPRDKTVSATSIRELCCKEPPLCSVEFRKGVIWALGKKEGEDGTRNTED